MYKDALDVLLKKWDTSRGIKRDEIYKNLSLIRKESLFSLIAAHSFEKNMYFIKSHYIEDKISSFVKGLPGYDNLNEIDPELILKAIESQHGIIVERAINIYSFSHLTLQEYFTAKYIVNHKAGNEIDLIISKYLFDNKWREVFLLIAGMLTSGDNYIYSIRKTISNRYSQFKTKKLEQEVLEFIHFVEEMRNSESEYSPAVCRIFNMRYLFEVGQHNTKNSERRSLVLSALEKIKKFPVPNNAAPALARSSIQYGWNYDFTNESLNGINEYLNASLIIIESLKTECYISKSLRKFLYDTILMEPFNDDYDFESNKSIFE